MNIGTALETYRFWSRHSEILEEKAARADPEGLRSELRKMRPDCDALLAALKSDGVAAIPGYWSAEKAAAGCTEIDRLIAEYPKAVNLSSGSSDKRMFGVEAVSPLLAEFHNDAFAKGVGEAVSVLSLYNFATLGARIDASPSNNGSGDGWHRDAHGFQFKSILYLCDVGNENGPFEYLVGSHKLWRAALDTARGDLPAAPSSRYTVEAIDRMVKRKWVSSRMCTAKAGTLLLVNTAGIHRGMPLRSGSRYALTNYYFHPFQIDRKRVEMWPTLMPGAADRIIRDLRLP